MLGSVPFSCLTSEMEKHIFDQDCCSKFDYCNELLRPELLQTEGLLNSQPCASLRSVPGSCSVTI